MDNWINTQTRQPPEPGWYTVRCLQRGDDAPGIAFWSGTSWLNSSGADVIFGHPVRLQDEWLDGSLATAADPFQNGRKEGLETGAAILNGIAEELFKRHAGQKGAKAQAARCAARYLTTAAITLRGEAMRPAGVHAPYREGVPGEEVAAHARRFCPRLSVARMTPAELAAYALHLRFDAMVKASPDVTEYFVLGGRFQDRVIPPELAVHQREKGRLAGFSRVLLLRDRARATAYVAALQDGHFWPFDPAPTDGKGTRARNERAAKELRRRFEAGG